MIIKSKYRRLDSIAELEVGDIIRNYNSRQVYVVTSRHGNMTKGVTNVIAVRTQNITESNDWEVREKDKS